MLCSIFEGVTYHDLSEVSVILRSGQSRLRPGRFAVDDDKSTRGTQCAWAGSRGRESDIQIEIDMGLTIDVDGIEVLSRSDCCCKYYTLAVFGYSQKSPHPLQCNFCFSTGNILLLMLFAFK